ncbi:substrate-binding domain-containing protein [Nocardia spumae]|uniref:substrate-binding domain-containing protein n=1 Tax=Nocardia spumae TaxID=2887190 RepID=UPI001D137593|nr:substrate-binding domain-containing protein [Nocardia spumae]
MGTHRSADGSRGVSKSLVITVVAVLLLIAAVGGWLWLSNRSASENRSAAGQCIEGPVTLPVTVDPDIAGPVRAAADRYNATSPQVRDHCAKIAVTVQPTAAMVAGLTAPNWDAGLGQQPGLWIPSSTRAVEQMRVPGLVQGAPASVAVSPIVVAAPDQLAQALTKADLSWSDLPRLQRGSLGDIGLGSWGGLKMALPPGDGSLAAAVAVGSAVSGSDPLTDDSARSGQVVAAISGLAAEAPESSDPGAALAAVADSAHAATSPIHAVAVTEQQAKAKGVSAFRPTGAAPVADHPAAMLTGNWVDKTQNLVAGMFADYLRAPAQQKLFTDNGFEPAAATPAPTPPKSVLDGVQSVLAHPVLGVQSTILIDTSASMAVTDGSMSRLNNTLAAVQSTLDTMPPDFGAGAWVYARDIEGGKPYRVVAPTAALSTAHRSELSTALGRVALNGSTTDRTYPALEAAYRSAVEDYATGKTNSVLLITGGPNDESSVSGDQLLTQLTSATDGAHKVRIDVIVIGGQGTQTLQNLAQKTGGTYTKVSTSDDMSFGTAVNHALTTP